MSIHRSLKTKGKLIRSRNVWTRVERLNVLKREGKWNEGDSILGLPKVRTRFKVKTKKQLKEEAARRAQEAKSEKETKEEKPKED